MRRGLCRRNSTGLSCRLNDPNCISSRRSAGKLFHTWGPATEKLLSPKVSWSVVGPWQELGSRKWLVVGERPGENNRMPFSDLLSLDFVVNRFFMKLFKTNNIDVVKTCQQYFNFEIPSTLWRKRCLSFDIKFTSSENIYCKVTTCSF